MDKKEVASTNFMPDDLFEIICILERGEKHNRGVSHYRILPISRDIGWPVQQLDYFRL